MPLGDVQGFGVGGSHVSRDMQLDWARSDVFARAAELGATHVVFVSERVEPNRLTLEGVAYRCGRPPRPHSSRTTGAIGFLR